MKSAASVDKRTKRSIFRNRMLKKNTKNPNKKTKEKKNPNYRTLKL